MLYREIMAVCSVTHYVDIRIFNLMVNILTTVLHHVALQ
jgi:hypothetical protein